MTIYRLAVLADIHGNLPAFEAVLRDLERRGPVNAYLAAGDIAGGPGQQVILDRLVELKAVMIQGNGEQRIAQMAAGTAPDAFYTSQQAAFTRWVYAHLSPEQREFLRRLPEQRTLQFDGADPIRIVHGSPRRVNELVLPNRECHPNLYYNPVLLEEVIALVPEPVIVFGHTHLQWQARQNDKLALNPGAVSFPEDGYIGAQYAILEWDGAQWLPAFYQVAYDLNRLKNDYQQSGFLASSPLARVILCSIFSGKDYLPVYFAHVQQVSKSFGRSHEGHSFYQYYPDDVWEAAEKTFPWPAID